jgi:hypothetical protein
MISPVLRTLTATSTALKRQMWPHRPTCMNSFCWWLCGHSCRPRQRRAEAQRSWLVCRGSHRRWTVSQAIEPKCALYLEFLTISDRLLSSVGSLALLKRPYNRKVRLPLLKVSIQSFHIPQKEKWSPFWGFFFCNGTGIWTWGLGLGRQVLCHLSYASSSSYFSYFSDKFSHFCLEPPLDCDPPTHAAYVCSWDYRHELWDLTSYVEMGALINFWPRLELNLHPPDLCLLSSWDYRRAPSLLARDSTLPVQIFFFLLRCQQHHPVNSFRTFF